MRSDMALLTLEDGGPPIQNPSTAAEDARLASLISLDSMLKQIKVLPLQFSMPFSCNCYEQYISTIKIVNFEQDILRQSSVNTLSKSKKKAMLASLDELTERMPSLLNIDHPCAQRNITDAHHVIEVCIVFFIPHLAVFRSLEK